MFTKNDDITLTSTNQIQDICKDFFNSTGISYFNFVRVYYDGSYLSLCNNHAWSKFLIQNHKKYHLMLEGDKLQIKSGCLVWDAIEDFKDNPLTVLARDQFNLDHWFTLIARYHSFIELYHFATSKAQTKMNIFYLNNQDILQSFALFFKDKAHKLIQASEVHRYDLLDGDILELGYKLITEDHDFEHNEFFKVCPINRFFLTGDLKDTYLSTREAECLAYLYDGLNPKDIAKELKISHRTIEGYIEQIKHKMDCKYKNELLKKAKESGFQAIYDVIMAMKSK